MNQSLSNYSLIEYLPVLYLIIIHHIVVVQELLINNSLMISSFLIRPSRSWVKFCVLKSVTNTDISLHIEFVHGIIYHATA